MSHSISVVNLACDLLLMTINIKKILTKDDGTLFLCVDGYTLHLVNLINYDNESIQLHDS